MSASSFIHATTLASAVSLDTNVDPAVDDRIIPLKARSTPSTDSSKLNVASVPLPAAK